MVAVRNREEAKSISIHSMLVRSPSRRQVRRPDSVPRSSAWLAFNAVRTSGIAGSIDDTGRKAERAGTLPGTRCEREALAAIHRGHSHPTARHCSRRRIRPQPTPVRQRHTRAGRLQRRQGGSSSRLLFGSSPAINIGVENIVPAWRRWRGARAGKNRKEARSFARRENDF